MRAYEILQRYNHGQIDTEHLLLALLEQPEGLVSQILGEMEVDSNVMRGRVDDVLKALSQPAVYGGGTGQVFITPRVKRLMDLAGEEAKQLDDEYISTEHLFLAMTRERNTPTVRKLVRRAGCSKVMTVSPPPAVGGLVMRGVSPFDCVFEGPYGMNMVPALRDMIDQCVGVIQAGDLPGKIFVQIVTLNIPTGARCRVPSKSVQSVTLTRPSTVFVGLMSATFTALRMILQTPLL